LLLDAYDEKGNSDSMMSPMSPEAHENAGAVLDDKRK
jgi:hypothetical protein